MRNADNGAKKHSYVYLLAMYTAIKTVPVNNINVTKMKFIFFFSINVMRPIRCVNQPLNRIKIYHFRGR